jgi:8-oxo-dGTP pyrophosphatase MutT (NUDIX family)
LGQQAAARELYEETGLSTRWRSLVQLPTQHTAIRGQPFSMVTFLAPHAEGTLAACDETTPEWVYVCDLDRIHLLPNVAACIREADRLRSSVLSLPATLSA